MGEPWVRPGDAWGERSGSPLPEGKSERQTIQTREATEAMRSPSIAF